MGEMIKIIILLSIIILSYYFHTTIKHKTRIGFNMLCYKLIDIIII